MKKIPLDTFIEAVKEDLLQANRMARSRHDLPHLRMERLSIEVQVAVETGGGGDGKMNFWVLELGASRSGAESTIQTIKIDFVLAEKDREMSFGDSGSRGTNMLEP